MDITNQKILNFIAKTEEDVSVNLKSFMVTKDDKVITKFTKKPYDFDDKQLLFSVTKTVTAIGIGMAIDRKLLSLDDKILPFFQNKLPSKYSDNLELVTIKDLLTMSSGLHDDKMLEIFVKQDWQAEFLQLDFVEKPGSFYYYSTLGSHMLAVIFEKAAGKSLKEFISENLFTPLDISDFEWGSSPGGVTLGGMGLSLKIADMSKIGQLFLNRGCYNGVRILSEQYVDLATTTRILKDSSLVDDNSYQGNGYGFLVHIGKNWYYRLDGAFGQICLVAPDMNVVVTVTSTETNIEHLLKYIYDELLFSDDKSIISDEKLADTINNLTYLMPNSKGNQADSLAKNMYGSYSLDKKANGLAKIVLSKDSISPTGFELNSIYLDGANCKVRFDTEKPVRSTGLFMKDAFYAEQKYLSFAQLKSATELELTVYYLETPYIVKFDLEFSDDSVRVKFFINVAFTLADFEDCAKLEK